MRVCVFKMIFQLSNHITEKCKAYSKKKEEKKRKKINKQKRA